MFNRTKRSRRYLSPSCKVTPMMLESNFCQTVLFNVQVNELQNMNDPNDPLGVGDAAEEVFYFES